MSDDKTMRSLISDTVLYQIAELEKERFSTPWTFEMLQDTLGYSYNRLFIETAEQGVSGYLIASYIADETELLRIAVAKSNERQGIAKRLLKTYFETAPEDINRFLLEVRESNSSARGLYEKMGYKTLALRKDYYDNPKEHAVIYEFMRE